MKVVLFKIAQKITRIFGLLLLQNLLPIFYKIPKVGHTGKGRVSGSSTVASTTSGREFNSGR